MLWLILLYVVSVVAANSAVAAWGPGISVLTAFLCIGLNITVRDRLHDEWHGMNLWPRMFGLIIGTSLASWLINPATGRIALASAIAFLVSETVDALTYHRLRHLSWGRRSNGSNVVSAGVDSILFPVLAFGMFLPWVMLGQFAAKMFGGGIWVWVLRKRVAVVTAVLSLVLAGAARAQIVSIDAGVIRTVAGTNPVAELFVASPPLVLGTRVFGITTLQRGGDLAYQVQASRAVLRSRHGFIAANGGALFLRFRNYRPWGILGGQGTLFIPHSNLSLIAVASYAPADSWHGTYLLKLSATGWYRR